METVLLQSKLGMCENNISDLLMSGGTLVSDRKLRIFHYANEENMEIMLESS